MKRKFYIPVIILFILVAFCTYFIKKYNSINIIKKSYSEFIITNKNTNLYDSNRSVVGSIESDLYFELDNVSKYDGYFKVKDYDYYLYYKDVDKVSYSSQSITKDYYVDLGKEITTGDNTLFYQNGILKMSLNNSFQFNVNKMDNEYYYINFSGNFFQIKIADVLYDKDIQTSPISNYVSVLYYNSVNDNCNSSNCVSTDEFKNELSFLKENGFYTIDIEDYKLWLNGYINLKEKAIFIISNQVGLNDISSLYGMFVEENFDSLTYSDSNFKSEKGNIVVPRYPIISKTTIDIFKQIVSGENITYTVQKPILQSHNLPREDSNASQIAVLNYHFFYDPEIGETCPDGNCKKVQDFENELIFLKNNNYKTLTMDEFTKWMYGEIELPARSVLITVDDGAMGTGMHNGNKLIPLLEKYQIHATLFLITGWWSSENYISPFLDIESHTNDMHEGNYCSGVPRGSKLLCSTREQVLDDLSKSAMITNSKNAFCFPMYVYNDTTMDVLKEIGFKLAFVGGDRKATRNSDKYKIPRYHIYRETSLDQFIDMVS